MATKKKMLQAAAGNAGGAGLNVEEVFSTYLYEGNGGTQTITNGVDLDGEGGLVWIKSRGGSRNHCLTDTERGAYASIASNLTSQKRGANTVTSFLSSGFTVAHDTSDAVFANTTNVSGEDYASWTFRKAPKFFDVVTYTGTGAFQNISHNLGSVPGMMMVKKTNGTGDWLVYHRHAHIGQTYQPVPERKYLNLNDTGSVSHSESMWGDTAPTDTAFSVGADTQSNSNGDTYVAYLFAHNDGDGEFGGEADADIIKCGSYIGNGSTNGPEIDLGFEPQWVMIKSTQLSGPNWMIFDTMRGWDASQDDYYLSANSGSAEANYRTVISGDDLGEPTSTGFKLRTASGAANSSGKNYIYIAIRRGTKVPESADEVFDVVERAGTGTDTTVTNSGFVTDLALIHNRTVTVSPSTLWASRLTGFYYMGSDGSGAETENSLVLPQPKTWDVMNGVKVGNSLLVNATSSSSRYLNYLFKRAPHFYDTVTYTGTGAVQNVKHSLGIPPELLIVKARNVSNAWMVYTAAAGATKYIRLDGLNTIQTSSAHWNNTEPTETQFTVGTESDVNYSTGKFVAHLFGSVSGVSKVGTYVGDGTNNRTIDCGFSSGARFVVVKDINDSSDWYVLDSEHGIVSGNDPFHVLNGTTAALTSWDVIDPDNSGFQANNNASFPINKSGRTYIFLAIA